MFWIIVLLVMCIAAVVFVVVSVVFVWKGFNRIERESEADAQYMEGLIEGLDLPEPDPRLHNILE